MRKSTLFISTALTIFMLVVVYGVVSAYQENVKRKDATAQATAEPVVQEAAASAVSIPEMFGVISPEQATALAVEFMGDTTVYGVEVVEYEGTPAFLVTFSSGKLVYVSPTGEIIAISEVQPVVVMDTASNNNNNNGHSANNSNGDNHDEHENEHEEHDD